MTIDSTVFSTKAAGIATKKYWSAPRLEALTLLSAQGSTAGSLCDKFGSLSASQGHDRCNAATK